MTNTYTTRRTVKRNFLSGVSAVALLLLPYGTMAANYSVTSTSQTSVSSSSYSVSVVSQGSTVQSLSNSQTGANSINTNSVSVSKTIDIDVDNNVIVSNNTTLDLNSGNNTITNNTVIGEVSTGGINSPTTIVNQQSPAPVVLNLASLPASSPNSNQTSISNSETGANSTNVNTVSQTESFNLSSTSFFSATNNLTVATNTGGNNISGNTVVEAIKTGAIDVAIHIVNFLNVGLPVQLIVDAVNNIINPGPALADGLGAGSIITQPDSGGLGAGAPSILSDSGGLGGGFPSGSIISKASTNQGEGGLGGGTPTTAPAGSIIPATSSAGTPSGPAALVIPTAPPTGAPSGPGAPTAPATPPATTRTDTFTLLNSQTGESSTNGNAATLVSTATIAINNSTDISNNTGISADSGSNSVSNNSSAGDVTTGSVAINNTFVN